MAIATMPLDAAKTTRMKLNPAQGGRGLTCEAMIAVAPPAYAASWYSRFVCIVLALGARTPNTAHHMRLSKMTYKTSA